MMRAAVNRISDWFDGGDDAYDSLLRFLAFIGLIFGAVILLIALFVVGYMLLGGPQQESLFCANGHELVSRPTTHIVGKVPIEGVEVTCP